MKHFKRNVSDGPASGCAVAYRDARVGDEFGVETCGTPFTEPAFMLYPGDLAPFFQAASSVNPRFTFDTVGGRYIVLTFFISTQIPASERFLKQIVNRGERFDVNNFVFFGVTTDPGDVERIQQQDPGRMYFYDLDLEVSKKYGLVEETPVDAETVGSETRFGYTPKTFILDQSFRILAVIHLTEDTTDQIDRIFDFLDTLPPLATLRLNAPVITIPYVFESSLCKELTHYYETQGGEDSGFMRDVDGKTVAITDYSHKRRYDCEIVDQGLIRATQERLIRRVVPAIKQAYQFDVTRIERHIVACYDAEHGAHFRAHRDNTTLGTAHRRFAVTMNLNSDEYEGAELWFPEFGPKKYKGPTGSATVFSCSLLHEVVKVTRGKRYAFLPFLYDEAASVIREQNRKYLGNRRGATAQPAACGTAAAPITDQSADAKPQLTGECGCGNPNGCGTCLSAATYQIGVPGQIKPRELA